MGGGVKVWEELALYPGVEGEGPGEEYEGCSRYM